MRDFIGGLFARAFGLEGRFAAGAKVLRTGLVLLRRAPCRLVNVSVADGLALRAGHDDGVARLDAFRILRRFDGLHQPLGSASGGAFFLGVQVAGRELPEKSLTILPD